MENHLQLPLTTLSAAADGLLRSHSDEQMEMNMSSITLEIRAAEGGDDAKLFVGELAVAYERLCLAEG
ncbi:PCRF domain-containing protein [Agrobacterium rubi]|nr:PCRF domain-containing protein [Agrobacterium rubi]NTF24094.1 PCRF domain-containing protein [Agrobacterium rubi]